MIIKRITILGVIIVVFCGTLFSQKNVIYTAEQPFPDPPKRTLMPRKVVDSAALQATLPLLADYYHQKGYIAFSIDTVRASGDTLYADCFIGPCYRKKVIRIADSTLEALPHGVPIRSVRNGALPFIEYARFAEKVVQQYENNGHPFCQVSIEETDFEQDTIGTLSIVVGPAIVYDSIIVKGDAKVRPSFLQPYLNWRRKRRYSEAAVSQIPTLLERLPYITITREPGVEFVGDRAFLYLFLDRQRVNQFDGYIGLVPVSSSTGKVMLNGEVTLKLQNLFTIGERLSLQWRAPERYSQYLDIQAEFPYLFRTPIGVAGSFTLDKKDTTYLNMSYLAALQYSFAGSSSLQASYRYTTSALLSVAPGYVTGGDTLAADFHKSLWGLRLNVRHVDNVVQPWSGLEGHASVSAGVRQLLPSAQAVAEGETALKSTHYLMEAELNGYVAIGKRWGWAAGVQGATQFGGEHLYNDLFRIGGTHTLQGFDEQSLFASTYLIARTEFRFRFARLSYLCAFFNAAWYERNLRGAMYNDWPFGFGIGATIHTKAGNLYLSYALGQQKESPISFKTGKIHFGIDVSF